MMKNYTVLLLVSILFITACDDDDYGKAGGGSSGGNDTESTWDCDSESCVENLSEDGAFSTKEDCLAICGVNDDDDDNDCNYINYTGEGNCPEGYYPVGEDACCSVGSLYYAEDCDNCFSTCEAARDACGGNIYRANTEEPPDDPADNCGDLGTFTDSRDGQTYKTVNLGDKIWMAENLNFETPSSRCMYDDPELCAEYGRLYNFQEAMMNICPPGWRLPFTEEFVALANNLGGESIAGGKMKTVHKWEHPNTGATNESCFSALPGGLWDSQEQSFKGFETEGHWWSYEGWGYRVTLNHNAENVTFVLDESISLYSCRCIKN